MPPTAPASPRESATGTPGGAAVPRLFQGKFASTRRPFTPRRPYDYELLDERGVRIAFLDVTRLPQTLQVEPLLEHTVVAYGALKAVPGTQDVVLVVESIQAR